MKRRTALALGTTAVAGALGGCLDAWRSRLLGPDNRAAPAETTTSTQFQYDARNTGVAGSDAPESVVERWGTRVSPIEGGLSVANDRVVVAARGNLVALDADGGDELWDVRVGQDTETAPALTADTAYVATWNGGAGEDRGVVAVALDDGSERWRAVPEVGVTSAPTLAEGTVYVGGSLHSEAVIALDAADGRELWRFEAGQYATTPAVADGRVYVGGGSEHVAYALDADDGTEVWRFEADEEVWTAPTVVDGVVYVGSRDGVVYALDADTGQERWRAQVGSDVRDSVAVTGDTVYVPARGSFVALDPTGTERWSIDVQDFAYAPTVAGDGIVVADSQAAFCLDAADGTELWRREGTERRMGDVTPSGIGCAPVVADGVAYVASDGGDVHALEHGT